MMLNLVWSHFASAEIEVMRQGTKLTTGWSVTAYYLGPGLTGFPIGLIGERKSTAGLIALQVLSANTLNLRCKV